MTDYALTAGQQQQIINHLNAGHAVYVEGNDFGYFHGDDNVYSMFGCSFLGDDDKVVTLEGITDTCMEGAALTYAGGADADDYMDWIGSLGGDLSLKSEEGKYRLVSYAGRYGTYRAMHLTLWFGALKDAGASHSKAELMTAFIRYLSGDNLVPGLNDTVSASAGGSVDLFLENPSVHGGREYVILGSMTGTSPGIPVGSVVLPIHFDIVTQTMIPMIHTSTFDQFHGNLDPKGRAMATLNTPAGLDPGTVGVELYFAYFVMNPEDLASNPASVTIQL
jgi:hypothetical protein